MRASSVRAHNVSPSHRCSCAGGAHGHARGAAAASSSAHLPPASFPQTNLARDMIAAPGAHILSTDCRSGKVAADPMDTDVVIYHADCPDGFAAAFAAWKALGSRATYIAAEHGSGAPLSLNVEGKHVVVADYCFPADVTQRMMREAASFIVLDHHASAQAELAGVGDEYKVFNMLQSGATLSWNYFHGADVPAFFRYIEDKDIWRWALTSSREFSAGFMLPFTFEAWDAVFSKGDAGVASIIAAGETILAYQQSVIQSHVRKAVPCVMKAAPTWRGMIVNATLLSSEIGNVLATLPDVDYALMWSLNHSNPVFSCSLRSASDDIDVSLLAKQFGGGGHRRASGFGFSGTHIHELLLSLNGKPLA